MLEMAHREKSRQCNLLIIGLFWRQSGVVAGHREIKQRRIVQEVQPPLLYEGCAANAPLSRQNSGAVGNNNRINLQLMTILLLEALGNGLDKVIVELLLNQVDGTTTEATTHNA